MLLLMMARTMLLLKAMRQVVVLISQIDREMV